MSITAAIVAVASTVASAASAVAGAVGAVVGGIGSAIGAAVGTTAATLSGLAAGVLPTVGAALTTISTISTVASFGLTVAGAITGDQSLMKAAMWTGIGGAVAGLGAAAAGTASAASGAASAGNAAAGNTAELTIANQAGQAITPAFESTAGTSINAATNAATPGLLGSAGTKAMTSLSNSMGSEYATNAAQGANVNPISVEPVNQLPAFDNQMQAPNIEQEASNSLRSNTTLQSPTVNSNLDLTSTNTPVAADTTPNTASSKFSTTAPAPTDTSGTVSTSATGDVKLNNFGQKGIGDYKDFVSSGFSDNAPSAASSVNNAVNNTLPTATDISKQASSGLWDTVKNYGGKALDFMDKHDTLVGTGLKMIQGASDYSANKEAQQMKLDYEQTLRKQAGLRYDPIAVSNYYKNLGKFATRPV